MRSRLTALFLLWVAPLLGLLTGCGGGNEVAREPLRIAFVPQTDMEERYAGAYRALKAYLEPRLGMPVEIISLENANAAIEGLRAGKIDVCNFSPWPFLIAETKIGLEALLLTKSPNGEPNSYRGVLVTNRQTGLKTPEDLKRRRGDLVFAFEEPVSTSGHFVPRNFLHSVGISAEDDFKRVIYGTDGITNLLAVRAGRVDVAALSDTSLQRALDRGRIAKEEIVVLWISPPVLSTVIAVRGKLPAALKAQLARLYLELPESSPDHWVEIAKQFSVPIAGYLPAAPDSLDYFRRAIREVPGLQLAN
jgi:phosphonate transport system substrate-binding protein